MNIQPRQYWFPAKRYGWGWGLPVVWQGWAVLIGYLVAVTLIASWVPPHADPESFLGLLVAVTLLLGLIVWRKGEPPDWHWGE
ncbi:MAG TPA: hypothetical protein VIG31_00195 [Rhodanobacteraceae bacterium]|jgi:hypothetical protein